MYLSRLTLKRSPEVAALAQLLNPAEEGARLDAHHRLIWTAFAGDAQARRDFLWRAEGEGRFLVLSARPPAATGLFDEPQVKPFAPDLRAGDRLACLLRANATRTVKTSSGKQHRDVVMAALHPVPKAARAAQRDSIAQEQGARWLEGQGARAGFDVVQADITGYRVLSPPAQGTRRPRFGVIDIEAQITLTDPDAFRARLAQGFGRAKAFGCGLMLIRRV